VGVLINREIEEGCKIGLWEVEEDYEHLFGITYLNDEDIRRLNTFKNLNRKTESLSVRALLQQMTHPKARVVYRKKSRKPYLEDKSYNISVSHSHKYTAILLGKGKQVGIDLEYMSHNIERLAHKFINHREYISSDPKTRREHLYIHWCAKEALYKIGVREDVNFQDDLILKPFEVEQEGDIIGIVHNYMSKEEFRLRYQIFNNYVWVYCVK